MFLDALNVKLLNVQLKKHLDWTLDQLDIILKNLKKDASRDLHGYANEIFAPKVAGTDLKIALLTLMNNIKDQQIIPDSKVPKIPLIHIVEYFE